MSIIVFPMMGKSSRFFDAGFERPKYELLVNGESVFSLAVRSFESYFKTDFFYFLVRPDFDAKEYVTAELVDLGIVNYEIIVFECDTLGQADTVYQGLKGVAPEESVYIFNIDTFRPGFRKPIISEVCDGYLEVFRGDGDHWSFVEAGESNRVLRTTEKDRISDLCSDGLYYFRKKIEFDEAFEGAIQSADKVKGEYYVAPLFNSLIKNGKDIRYVQVDKDAIVFCGTPVEYSGIVNKLIS